MLQLFRLHHEVFLVLGCLSINLRLLELEFGQLLILGADLGFQAGKLLLHLLVGLRQLLHHLFALVDLLVPDALFSFDLLQLLRVLDLQR